MPEIKLARLPIRVKPLREIPIRERAVRAVKRERAKVVYRHDMDYRKIPKEHRETPPAVRLRRLYSLAVKRAEQRLYPKRNP